MLLTYFRMLETRPVVIETSTHYSNFRGMRFATHRRHVMTQSAAFCFQLAFRSLFDSGRGYAFPCDKKGQVNMDRLSEHCRANYLFARAMVGRDLCPPAIEMVSPQPQ